MKTETRLQSPYSQFIEQVKSSQVQRVIIKPDRLEYTLKSEFGNREYYTEFSGQKEDISEFLRSNSDFSKSSGSSKLSSNSFSIGFKAITGGDFQSPYLLLRALPR